MRLQEIHLEGFGRLANLHLSFKPGLNVVYGPNEAGKTTLQRAILALLYGAAGRPEMLEAYRPWGNEAFFAGSLTYMLDSGEAFRAARRFAAPDGVTLRTCPEGVDVSDRFPREAAGEPAFAAAQLGLPAAVFERLCAAGQDDQDGLEDAAGPLVEALIRILTAAPGAVEARALQILQTAQQEQAAAALALQKRQDELVAERRHVVEQRRALQPQILALNQVAGRLEALELQREQALLALARSSRSGSRTLAAAGDELAEALRESTAEAAKWQPWAGFPIGLRDEVLQLSARRSHLQQECAAAEERARPAEEALAALQAEEAALRASLDPAAAAGPSAGLPPTVQSLADAWQAASNQEAALRQRLGSAPTSLPAGAGEGLAAGQTPDRAGPAVSAPAPGSPVDAGLAAERQALEPALALGLNGLSAIQQRLQAARERLTQSKKALSSANAQWVRLSTAPAAAMPAGRSGKGKAPVRVEPAPTPLEQVRAEMLRCREESEAAQRALSAAESSAIWQLGSLLGNNLTDTAFAQLRARLERFLQATAPPEGGSNGQKAARDQLEAARERRLQAELALQAELVRMGVDATDIPRALAALSTSAPQQDPAARELERLRAEVKLELLRARAEALQVHLSQRDERRQALAALEAQLAALLGQAGIEVAAGGDLDAAIAAFDEGVENRRRYDKAQEALATASRYQRALLDAQATAIAAAGMQKGPLPELKQSEGAAAEEKVRSSQEYAALLQEVETQRLAAQEDYDRRQSAIQEACAALRHLAEIDEEAAAVEAEQQRLQRFAEGLQRAHDAVSQAAIEFQKQFAPRLDALLQDGLSRVTHKRYTQATVDPQTLAVTVLAPETGSPVPVERLGAGVRRLTYLLLRLGLARLMSLSGEPLPLLLDEPLALCDRARAEPALQYLLQRAEDTQIFLFTREEWVKTWLEKKRSELHQVLVLNGPAATA